MRTRTQLLVVLTMMAWLASACGGGSGSRSVWAVGYKLSTAGNHGVVYRLQ